MVIARLLCRAFGHRWQAEFRQREWHAWILSASCRRCGQIGALVLTERDATRAESATAAWRDAAAFGDDSAIDECRKRAACRW